MVCFKFFYFVTLLIALINSIYLNKDNDNSFEIDIIKTIENTLVKNIYQSEILSKKVRIRKLKEIDLTKQTYKNIFQETKVKNLLILEHSSTSHYN